MWRARLAAALPKGSDVLWEVVILWHRRLPRRLPSRRRVRLRDLVTLPLVPRHKRLDGAAEYDARGAAMRARTLAQNL